jgi:6-phosphogluconolactonase
MSKEPTLYAFPSKSVLQKSLATYVIKAQNVAFQRHPNSNFRVAVSGGSLPSMLAAPELLSSHEIDWSRWEIFFADERAVPLDHEDSNYGLLKKEFLDKIPGDKEPRVVAINEEYLEDTQELADDYEQALIRSFAAKDSVKLPIFDLILLGCGPDGHTCSLFPGHPLLREDVAWVAPIEDSPKPPPRRITLTRPVITHAINIAFVATGAGKQEIMAQIFDTHPEVEGGEVLPCALVNLAGKERVSWFTDEDAVKGVAFQKRSSLL